MKKYTSLNEGFKYFTKNAYGKILNLRVILSDAGFSKNQVDMLAKDSNEYLMLIVNVVLDKIRDYSDQGSYSSTIIAYTYCFRDNTEWSPSKEAHKRGFAEKTVIQIYEKNMRMFAANFPVALMRELIITKAKIIIERNQEHVFKKPMEKKINEKSPPKPRKNRIEKKPDQFKKESIPRSDISKPELVFLKKLSALNIPSVTLQVISDTPAVRL